MRVVGVRGLRGGVGATSIVAGLAWAAARQGARVLAVDLCQDNLLGLHFGRPHDEQSGWSQLVEPATQWRDMVQRCVVDIDLLAHGGAEGSNAFEWLQQLSGYDLILLDMPPGLSLPLLALQLTVIQADANCHVRLYRHPRAANERLLLTQFSSRRALQQDLLDLWLQAGLPILSVRLHRDEVMACALAAKQPAGAYAPQSMIAHELADIANWCLRGELLQ